jgi:hypothetical protein
MMRVRFPGNAVDADAGEAVASELLLERCDHPFIDVVADPVHVLPPR